MIALSKGSTVERMLEDCGTSGWRGCTRRAEFKDSFPATQQNRICFTAATLRLRWPARTCDVPVGSHLPRSPGLVPQVLSLRTTSLFYVHNVHDVHRFMAKSECKPRLLIMGG